MVDFIISFTSYQNLELVLYGRDGKATGSPSLGLWWLWGLGNGLVVGMIFYIIFSIEAFGALCPTEFIPSSLAIEVS